MRITQMNAEKAPANFDRAAQKISPTTFSKFAGAFSA
jgi:hypothetical protein